MGKAVFFIKASYLTKTTANFPFVITAGNDSCREAVELYPVKVAFAENVPSTRAGVVAVFSRKLVTVRVPEKAFVVSIA